MDMPYFVEIEPEDAPMCQACEGNTRCPVCDGTRVMSYISAQHADGYVDEACATCDGDGTCHACDGTGEVQP